MAFWHRDVFVNSVNIFPFTNGNTSAVLRNDYTLIRFTKNGNRPVLPFYQPPQEISGGCSCFSEIIRSSSPGMADTLIFQKWFFHHPIPSLRFCPASVLVQYLICPALAPKESLSGACA
jgi:hypothetical protein